MTHKSIFLGKNKADFSSHEVKGEMINFENEAYYKIVNSNEMRPFFMSIVSDSNHWMFISSNGGSLLVERIVSIHFSLITLMIKLQNQQILLEVKRYFRS